ncbi:MAG: CCA tRNA nucleotidyltransferase [Nanopusillaceae archaeon]
MFEDILELIKPDEKERRKAYSTIEEFYQILKENGLEPFLGGSFAKDTWLRGDFDIDTFVLFEKDEKMSEKIENVLKKEKLDYIKIRGSRDYFRVNYKDYIFELVPVLKIKDINEAKNITDLSPFHVKYVKEKIEKTNLNDEIRLAKAFMKNINVYGAESYINGFSGYAVELLVIYYGSFINLIENASKWKPKVIIDIERYYKNFEEIKNNLSKDKLKSPIIIIDPINKYRNVGASVSIQKFSEFIYYSRLFLNDVDKKKYFLTKIYKSKEEIDNLANKYGVNILYLQIEGNSNNKDIKNTKALVLFNFIKRNISLFGFKIFNNYFYFENDKLIGYIMYYPKKLPEYEVREGPLIWNSEDFNRFYEKHKGEELFIRNSRIYAITKRKVNDIDSVIKHILDNYKNNIKEKAKYLLIETENNKFEMKF